MDKKESALRGAVIIGLMIGALGFVVSLFVPSTREMLKDPVASGIYGVMLGLWFKELGQATSYYFGGTKALNDANAKIADFATTPGAVTSDNDAAPVPIINNITQGAAQ